MAQSDEWAAEEEIWRLKTENEKLKDDLFALLQEDNLVSEATIRSDYQDICVSIEAWIDYITVDVEKSDFRKHYKGVLLNKKERRKLKELGLKNPEILGDYDNADCLVLSLVTLLQLDNQIFRNRYPIGVTKQQAKVIDKIVEGMSESSLRKEQLSIDKWRSETLIALTATREFKERQLSRLQEITDVATKAISPLVLDRRAFAKHEKKLRQDILGPALKLHQAIRTSIRQYEVQPPDLRTGPAPGQTLDESWTMKDIGTWETVKKTEKIVEPLYCLFPSIVRLEVGDVVTVLVKPVVIVNLTEPSLSQGSFTLEPRSIDGGSQRTASPRRTATGWEHIRSRKNDSPKRTETGMLQPRTRRTEDHELRYAAEVKGQRSKPGRIHSFRAETTRYDGEVHRERRKSDGSFLPSFMGKLHW